MQQLLQNGESKRQMHPRHHQRQEEHHQHLAVDGVPHLAAAHAHLLHDLEAGSVLVPLGNLLVVHDQRRGKQAHQPQQNAQKQQRAVHAHHRRASRPQGAVVKPDPRLLTPQGIGSGAGLLLHGALEFLAQIAGFFTVGKTHRHPPHRLRSRLAVHRLLLGIQLPQHALVRHHDAVAVGGRHIYAGLHRKHRQHRLHPIGVAVNGQLRAVKAHVLDVEGTHGDLVFGQIQRLAAQAAVHLLRDVGHHGEILQLPHVPVRPLRAQRVILLEIAGFEILLGLQLPNVQTLLLRRFFHHLRHQLRRHGVHGVRPLKPVFHR